MRKQMIIGSLLFLGAAGSAGAAEGLNYNLLEGGYGYTDIKGTSAHGDELWVGGSRAFGTNIFGFGHVGSFDVSGFKSTSLALGLGYHGGISESVDFVSGLSLEMYDPEGGSNETGFGLSVGLRGKASDNLELSGDVQYVDFGNGADGIVFSVGSRYYFTEAFAAGLDLSMDDDSDSTTIGITLRYDFGM